MQEWKNIKSFAVVRGDNTDKVKIALHDMQQYGHINFLSEPKYIEPEFADNVLVSVMGVPLKTRCSSAALVEVGSNAGAIINKLRKIHPPAHIVVVSPRHGVYSELVEKAEEYPEFDRSMNRSRFIDSAKIS
ncbi:Protein of unknown function DUF356 [Methanosalsum zhilinae DSM 4017]|uniref:DUF356 domain-containing protein n=1 Tax=Methanosalsum zhilinae (strain DSM 4017 / NBRC 107636 / OCM 62 / WeN5) TaxID=679901 RepID=F7XQP6_METZD|nr:DUF356 domain-containing protein [Methanosalsum zhilinae]AEH61645.1 Protein of unknown function DUF356 [Methanosalsum zhilinae DSM 4017]